MLVRVAYSSLNYKDALACRGHPGVVRAFPHVPGIDFFNRVAEVAEEDNHHPDVHLERYRDVTIELWTHAIGGLSENDFILAAKIDELPVEEKKK